MKIAVLLAAIISTANLTGNASANNTEVSAINTDLISLNLKENIKNFRIKQEGNLKLANSIQSALNQKTNSGYNLMNGPTTKETAQISTSTFNNSGTFIIDSWTNNGTFNNKKKDAEQEKVPLLEVTTGDLTNKGTFNNGDTSLPGGNVKVSKGKLDNQNSANFNNNGMVEIGKENEHTEESGEKLNNAGNLTNNSSGTITTHGGTNKNSGTFENKGSFNGTESKFENQTNGTVNNSLRFNTGDMTNEGKVKNTAPSGEGSGFGFFANSLNNKKGGSIENEKNADFTVYGELQNLTESSGTGKEEDGIKNSGNLKAGKLTNGGKITNDGGNITLQSTSGVETGDGSMTNNSTGTIDNNNGGGITVSGATTNNGGTINNNGGSFTTQDLTNQNSGNVNNTNSGNFNVKGNLENKGGSVTNNGADSTFTVEGKTTNGSSDGTTEDSIINNGGTFNAKGGLENKKDGKFTNKDGGNVEVSKGSGEEPALNNEGEIDNQSSWTTNGETKNGGTLDNSGTYNATGKVTNDESGKVENSGSFFATGDVENKGNLNNSSTFSVGNDFTNSGKSNEGKGVTNSGSFSITGDFTNSGDYANEGGDEEWGLTLQGALKQQTGGTFSNKGGSNVEIGSVENNAGSITNEGDNSTFKVTGSVSNNDSGTITNKSKKNGEKGGMSLGNVTNNGTITNEGGSLETSTLTNGSTDGGGKEGKVTNNNGGDINVTGELKNQKGSIENKGNGSTFNAKGKVTNGNGASTGSSSDATIKNSDGATFNADQEVENSGTITNDGQNSTFNAKNKVTNKNGGKIDNKDHGSFNADGGLTNENNGSTVTNGENSTFSVGKEGSNAELQNSGNIENKGFWNSNGKVTNNDGGKIDNSGNFQASDKVDNKGNLENSGTFNATGEVENSGSLNNSSIFGVGGNFTNSATGDNKGVTNSGTFSVNGESFTNSGNFTNTGDDGQLTLQGALKNETGGNLTNTNGANVDITGDITNNSGSITNETNSTFGVSGNVTNSSSGNITNKSKKDGDNGGMSIGGKLTNTSGTVTNQDGGTLDVAGDVENNGTINNQTGSDMTFNGKVTGGSSGGSSSDAKIDNKGTLTLNGDASGYTGAFTQENEDSVINVGSETNRDAEFFGGTSTVEKGTVNWWSNKKDAKSKLSMKGGTLNLESGSFFEFEGGGNISEEVDLNIKDGSTFDIGDGATLTLDGEDEWNGTIEIGDTESGGENKGGNLVGDGIKNGGKSVLKQSGGTSTFKNASDITISGDSTLTGGEVTLESGSTLTFDQHRGEQANAKFTLKGGSTLGLLNGGIDEAKLEDLTVEGDSNYTVDLSQRTYQADKFDFKNLKDPEGEGQKGGNLHVSNFNLLGDCPVDRNTKYQLFAGTNGGGEFPEDMEFTATNELQRTASGWFGLRPINGEKGYYDLYLAQYVPEEFRAQTAILGMYTNQLQVEDIITNHFIIHDETMINKAKNANKYSALSPIFAPYQKTYKDGGLWSKSYASFGRMDLTRPELSVGTSIYGTIAGVDLPAVELNNEWEFIPTGYVGYSGAHQFYQGVSSYQNAGQLGIMGTFIRNQDFITSILAYGGGYTNEMSYGGYEDNLGNWFAGSALKTAYNFHPFKDFIIQPTAYVSYNAFGRQSWHSDYGNIDMGTSMFNGINAGPGVNFILSKDTWSLYTTLQYLFFMNDGVKGTIGHIDLPETKLEHGVFSYGFGATKTFKDTFAGYAQINLYNAGITGIGFQLGLQWLFDMKLPWENKYDSANTNQNNITAKKADSAKISKGKVSEKKMKKSVNKPADIPAAQIKNSENTLPVNNLKSAEQDKSDKQLVKPAKKVSTKSKTPKKRTIENDGKGWKTIETSYESDFSDFSFNYIVTLHTKC